MIRKLKSAIKSGKAIMLNGLDKTSPKDGYMIAKQGYGLEVSLNALGSPRINKQLNDIIKVAQGSKTLYIGVYEVLEGTVNISLHQYTNTLTEALVRAKIEMGLVYDVINNNVIKL
jgi:hypothetical protein